MQVEESPDRDCRRGHLPRWVADGLGAGLLTGIWAPAVVLAVYALPDLKFGYPLVLLPLLMTGPLAVRSIDVLRGSGAAALAGVVSGLVVASSLAFGSQVLGVSVWGLTSAASAPPMPPLPRVSLLPPQVMTWAQQDVAAFQPILALGLGLLSALLRAIVVRVAGHVARALARSLRIRLILGLGGLTALTLMVGWVGFAALEEMHFRGHRLQLQVDWQRHLSEIQARLDAESLAAVSGLDASGHADAVDAIYAHLADAPAHPGIALAPANVRAVLGRYEPALKAASAAHTAYRARSDDAGELGAAREALNMLRLRIDEDAVDLVNADDLVHHQRLILIMFAVGLAGAVGVWMAHETASTITSPIRQLVAHLSRVARGEFSQRAPAGGPEELKRLAGAVDQMATDLDRLYAAERDGRAAAEAVATREHELAAAKEFWANTLVHDLKQPLSLIAGYAELFERGVLGQVTDSQHEAVGELQRAAGELLGLVDDVNDSFRLEASALPLHREPVSPVQLLWSAAAEHVGPDRRAPALRSPAGLPSVSIDARLVRRVLRNLIGNAYKHAGHQASVVLTAETVGDVVHFVVEDDGPGIPAEDRERVFERFVQTNGARAGSGLGLAFCKLVIEQHGGRIWAEAAPTSGTRICFALPADPANERAAERSALNLAPAA